jgi:DNA replication protein DnaC
MTSLSQTLFSNLEKLELTRMSAFLPNFMTEIEQKQLTFTEAMVTLTNEEIRFRQQQAVARLIERAHFPVLRRLGEFNFDFQPNLNRTQIMEFKNLAFLDNRENIVLIGNPGVGKTHLAIGIGIEACEQGKRVFFTTCHNLLAQLRTAYEKGYIERIMRRFARYDLLIIDEIGYLPIEHDEANLLFQLINARYEQKSTIITSNSEFSSWVDIFQNPTVTTAILDRLVHHVSVVKITGKSYRLNGPR